MVYVQKIFIRIIAAFILASILTTFIIPFDPYLAGFIFFCVFTLLYIILLLFLIIIVF